MDSEDAMPHHKGRVPSANSDTSASDTEQHTRLDGIRRLAQEQRQTGTSDTKVIGQANLRHRGFSDPLGGYDVATRTVWGYQISRYRWLAIVSILILITLLAMVSINSLLRSSSGMSTIASTPPVILPASNALECARGIAWAPNGQSLAILGNAPGPDAPSPIPPHIHTYQKRSRFIGRKRGTWSSKSNQTNSYSSSLACPHRQHP